MGEINVVPYIDVTLVLLIIFMITTPMLQTGVDVDLPKAESANVEVKEGKPPIIIHIYKEHKHKYEISVGDEDKVPVELEDINERVAAIVGANKDSQVLIAADGDVDYRSVVKVMTSLKNAGVPNVGLMTQPEDD